MSVRRGEIVLVLVPFSSGAGVKIRPALVVQADRNNQGWADVIIAPVTRTTHRASRGPTQLLVDPATPDGSGSGLLHVSVVRCESLVTVEQRLILRTIGRLSASSMAQIDDCLKASLDLP